MWVDREERGEGDVRSCLLDTLGWQVFTKHFHLMLAIYLSLETLGGSAVTPPLSIILYVVRCFLHVHHAASSDS